MARKSREQWSDAYRKRIESAERRGKEFPRGHPPGESVRRRERERAEEGLTGYEKAACRALAEKGFYKGGMSLDPDETEEWVRAIGYASFREFIGEVRQLNRQYRRELAAGTYVKGGHTQWWERMLARYEAPDVSFGYYH